ncbi:MAG: hypothetical protein AAF108_02650 [Planctomycetota bacterium]
MDAPRLSLALSSVARGPWLAALAPRDALRAVAEAWLPAGGRLITLDATAHGFRPRALNRSARRDLAAALRRDELELAGIDCFVPSDHFHRAATRGRAADAVADALGLAEDLAARRVALRAGEGLPEDVARELSATAERRGVTLVAYGEHGPLHPAAIADAADPAMLAAKLSGAAVVRWQWPVPVSGAEASTAAPLIATLGVRAVDLDLSAAGEPEGQIGPALDAWSRAADPFAA